MHIRPINMEDKERLIQLLDQLGYHNTETFITQKLSLLLTDPKEYLVGIVDNENKLFGFISIHIIPQLALEGDFARISYFSVSEDYRSMGAEKILENYCEKIARKFNCDRIDVHCHTRRENAHRFYHRQGYVESPKYFTKQLKY